MSESTISALLLASPLVHAPLDLRWRILPILGRIFKLIGEFRSAGPTPALACRFEENLQKLLRELGRQIVEWTYNDLEPVEPTLVPPEARFHGNLYRRRRKSKRRCPIWTLFGPITLARFLYQPYEVGEPAIFPLEINLGIVTGGATPALALRAAYLIADVNQQKTLQILKQDHGIAWSVERLRKIIAAVSEQMSQHRYETQVTRLLELLRRAGASKGRRKVVLAVGRDGVFVPVRQARGYQEAASGTVSVYDRSGRRLGTVYLGRMPEPGQTTFSEQLTRLIRETLAQYDGPPPRLCYITDAGWHPSEFYRSVLQRMRHLRTGRYLQWEWVIDYYHVCGYLTKLAEAIFGEGKEAMAWAKKMRRWLKTKPNGAYRILHSAAALRCKRGLRGPVKQFEDAYNYLYQRLRHLNYVAYRQRGLPIGSGVTEAACKTIFTQRFKQSGMTWSIEGGQLILDLRLLRLSNVWSQARQRHLDSQPTITLHPGTESIKSSIPIKKAA